MATIMTTKTCAYCSSLLVTSAPQQCPQCQSVSYCSSRCQSKARSSHRDICTKTTIKVPKMTNEDVISILSINPCVHFLFALANHWCVFSGYQLVCSIKKTNENPGMFDISVTRVAVPMQLKNSNAVTPAKYIVIRYVDAGSAVHSTEITFNRVDARRVYMRYNVSVLSRINLDSTVSIRIVESDDVPRVHLYLGAGIYDL